MQIWSKGAGANVQKPDVPYKPYETGFLHDAFGAPHPDDPDVRAAESCPDLRGYPNEKRVPPAHVDPWKGFATSPGWTMGGQEMLAAVLKGHAGVIESQLLGLSPWEFLHIEHVRLFELTDIQKGSRLFTVAYPLLEPAGPEGSFKLKPLAATHEVKFSPLHLNGQNLGKLSLQAVERAFIALVVQYLRLCKPPPPPACQAERCFQFARYKIAAGQLEVRVVCVKHLYEGTKVSAFGSLEKVTTGALFNEALATPARTMKLWSIHQLLQKARKPQLSLDPFQL